MARRVLIIGGGIAGLAAGSYLQRNGFETEIFEQHDLPGGLCTAWDRKGFRFDGCIHWLMGSSPRANLHHVWRELGAGDLEYLEWEVFTVSYLSDGDRFTLFTDPDRLESELIRISAQDAPLAREIADGVRRARSIDLPAATDKFSFMEGLRLLLALPKARSLLGKLMRTPISALIARARSAKLREALASLYGDEMMEDFPVAGLYLMLGFMAKRSCGYPLGGSLSFAQAIESRYLSFGGVIHYRHRVDQIVTEGARAVALKGSWGQTAADYVIGAGDLHDLTTRLLDGRYEHPKLSAAIRDYRRFPSLILISLGLNRRYPDLPHTFSFPTAGPIVIESAALKITRLGIRLFSFDPSTAPPGKTAAVIMIATENDGYWTELRASSMDRYAQAKQEVVDAVLPAFERYLPGILDAAEVVNVATPATFIRYTANWHGSYEGWLPTIKTMGTNLPRTLPGLDNLYLVGQWVNPGGGLPPCGIDGRKLARLLCRREKLPFRADGGPSAV